MATVDVLIPTYRRPAALAVTLTSLIAQTWTDFRVVISDQTEDFDPTGSGEVQNVVRILRAHGNPVEIYRNLPRRGMAQQRQFLLDKAAAPYALFIDDDLVLDAWAVERMLTALREEECGFVGMAVHGLSFVDDVRPDQEAIEFWEGKVKPEEIRPDSPEWERYKLHNAANVYHVQTRLGLTPQTQRKYKIAWVGGCTVYDTAKLRAAGGFIFWRELPPVHCGEDVLAQQRVMARYGGCGLIPSGVYHQELPTTLPDRTVNAPRVLDLKDKPCPRVSVLMPTYRQANFIRRAVESLKAQPLADWELIVVDDGSPDNTDEIVGSYLSDKRIRYYRLEENRGVGAALNYGLALARAPYIAYLPSDDVYYAEHLEELAICLDEMPDAVLAYSGVRHHYNRHASGQIPGYSLQPVQVLHRAVPERWLERQELVTEDLNRMFWDKLRSYGRFVGTDHVSCEWVDHPGQRHKLLQEPVGGINLYRQHFNIRHPLRFHTSLGNYIDEVERYRPFRERPDTPMARDGLKILLVGELAYNAERVLALEERGHKLYGLWMDNPYWYNTVGPLPFGHVQDIPRQNWQQAVREIQPDIIYALLNWQAVPTAHRVLMENTGIPFVWHFKEGPFICLEKGTWAEMVDLYNRSDGQIYISPEMQEWCRTVIPGCSSAGLSLVLDGDLPKREWFAGERSPLLSAEDGEIHTVVPGRPIGLHPHNVEQLARQAVHLHFYGDFTHGQWKTWIQKALAVANGYLHLHPNVDQNEWVREFSQYDAGWLHFFQSENRGDLRRAIWDDLNYPARLGTLAAAGLPMLQYDNAEALVATDRLAREYGLGLVARSMEEVATKLSDRRNLDEIRENVWRQRSRFIFDEHADRLVDFFRQVIDHRAKSKGTRLVVSAPVLHKPAPAPSGNGNGATHKANGKKPENELGVIGS